MIATKNLPNAPQTSVPADAEGTPRAREWNSTRVEYPRLKRIHELFAEQAQRTPDAVAVVHEDRQLTYRELNERAEALARVLRERGVGPEVRVGLCALRSLDMVVGLYAILKTGGAYLPLDPSYPPERLAFMLEDAQAPILLTQQALHDALPRAEAKILWLNALASSSSSNTAEPAARTSTRTTDHAILQAAPVVPPSSENLAYVIYTSGSTGKPKGVMVRHRNVVNFFTGMDQALGTEPGVWLAVTSISFDISVLELFWTLTRGFKVVLQGGEAEGARLRTSRQLQSRSNAARFTVAEQIRRHGVTHLQCTPTLAGLMLQDPAIQQAFKQVKCFLLGGEPLPPVLAEQLSANATLFNMYGPTETTVWSTFHRVARTDGPIPLGRPLANTQIYLLDPHLQLVPVGTEGELFIGGDGVTRGYLNRPELTAERFIPDHISGRPEGRLYRTGDLARYHEDGTLEFLGRADQQVKLRGFRIELGEIEAAIRQYPGVQNSVVSVWETGPDNKRLVGYFVPQPGANLEPAALKRYLKSQLPEVHGPVHVDESRAHPADP